MGVAAELEIDAVAGTPIQSFNGELETVQFLRSDLTAIAYHLIDDPKTMITGPGGGQVVNHALPAWDVAAGLSIVDPVALESALNQLPGVVTNGLFARRPADVLLLGTAEGVRRIDRSPAGVTVPSQ